MSISKEAIEAGARAMMWKKLPFGGRDLEISLDANAAYAAAKLALTAAAPFIAAEAVRAELMEVALMLEPFSGIGLANGATRNDVANWLRARADQLEGETK